MKKLLTVILALTLVLSVFSGCNTKSGKKKIGIIQLVDHPSLNTIRESLIKELANKGFKDKENITIDYQNGQNDQTTLKQISQKFAGNGYDLIIAIATPAAQAALGETRDIPILFSACNDPITSKLVDNLEKPGKNVTGTSDYLDVSRVFGLAEKLTPNVKTFGLMYNLGESNSVSTINSAKEYLNSRGIKCVEATVTNTSEVQQAILSLKGKADAVFIPLDNTIASAMATVSASAKQMKLPVYCGADSMVKDGGFATVGIDYTVLGRETGDMAAEILNGKKPGDMPVRTMKEVGTYINKTTASAIGVNISDDILKTATVFE